MTDKKKFGLVMPKKTDVSKLQINSIFKDDSDDDEVKVKKRPQIPQKKMITEKKIKAEVSDPSIYEYDEIYDEMKAKQTETSDLKEKKKSRYIETLLKSADKRKKEYERRIDRKIQVEREKEGDEFKDKEAFVTSAYKKKMLEKEEEEERERRENMLNDMMDVTKQKDLSGFYRHFLNQTVGEEKVPLFGEKQIKQEPDSDRDDSAKTVSGGPMNDNIDQDSDGIEIDGESENSSSDKDSSVESESKKEFKKKTLRRKKMKGNKSNASKSPDLEDVPLSERRLTSDSSSSDNESNVPPGSSLLAAVSKRNNVSKRRHDSSSSEEEDVKRSVNGDTKKSAPSEEKKQTVNIYAKRTVGDVFAEAQARFFQRMAMKNSGL